MRVLSGRLWLAASTALFFGLVLAVGFGAAYVVTMSAFDRIEASEVAKAGQQVQTALESRIAVLNDFGSTNSIWDNTYADVARANERAFSRDFQPQQLANLYGIDGIIGVGLTGGVRVGGTAKSSSEAFGPVPPGFLDPTLVRKLFDPHDPAGSGQCGFVSTPAFFLYCGFPSTRSDGGGPVVAGLIYFESLGPAGLASLDKMVGLNLKQIVVMPAGASPGRSLNSSFGVLRIGTVVRGANRIAVDVAVPAVGGRDLLLQSVQSRPIHHQAVKTLGELGVLVALITVLMFAYVRRQIIRPVQDVRSKMVAIASGEREGGPGADTGRAPQIGDLAHMAEELAAARDVARSASQAKSDFLSTMSHEIRTPMNGVIGLTELLLETELDQNQRDLASGVKVSAENLLVIINDILDFSKIEAGKLDLEEAPVDVAAIASDVGRILARTADAKGLELLVDSGPDVPSTLLGDHVRLRQVLLNLGSNAVKFTAEGEVVIRITAPGGDAERANLRFEVIDQGIGIAPIDQERLFQAFTQADSSTTRKFGGTGLGLAICRKLVDLMSGTLGVVSAPGEGSTFWFEVSLRRAETAPPSSPGACSPTLAGRRVLVVDDNTTNRTILLRQLGSWGADAVEAPDAFRALQLAREAAACGEPFELGLIDMNMPGMDGAQLAGALKQDSATAPMILLLLSSSGTRLSEAESRLRGFAASLTKPVRSSELLDCLVARIVRLDQEAPAAENSPPTATPDDARDRGVVLLVEDNETNRVVGSSVLAKLGFRFVVADDGAEAVAALESGHYDAVLMDCQMPVMDGYEATAEIRRIEGGRRRTPIIAMTAAAVDGDREKCMAAGMDDYLTKPIRAEAVASVLQRWVTRPAAGRPAQPGACSAGREPVSPLDQDQINDLRSLDDGDGEVFASIIEQFLAQADQGRRDLARLVEEGDAQALARAAHTLKGASANVGAVAVSAVCAELEAKAKLAGLDGAAGLVEQFACEMARAREALGLLMAGA
jgi:signal transduction histidine kinase/CheY-like chemotaxis protein/HPt (histidine-containing phosphotransfer) domain-containing protein